MGFGNSNYRQYWMGCPDDNGWKACSKLVIDQTGLDALLTEIGNDGWKIFQQFPNYNEARYVWNTLYKRWDSVN